MEKVKKIFIFDLDYTLLNTKELKKRISLAVAGKDNLSSSEIVKATQVKETKNIVSEVIKDVINFFYPGIIPLLTKMKKEGEMIILTKGAVDFQIQKIMNIPIELFHKSIIAETEDDKIKELSQIIQNNKGVGIYFFNDNPKENDRVISKFGHIIHIIPIKNNEFGYGVPILVALKKYFQKSG